jgi:hypothetical protein
MTRSLFALVTVASCAVACSPSPTAPQVVSAQSSSMPMLPLTSSSGSSRMVSGGSLNGIAGAMPAFYDDHLFTINFKELPPGGEDANIRHNRSINTIYQSDGCMPGGQMFVSVLDAIQGDGFNPLWREVQVIFASPTRCQQFTSDTDILAALAAHQVTLMPTSELYRCSVVGKP